jgi:hypothetical protein
MIRELADVDEAVLMHAHVHERTEGGHVRHDAGESLFLFKWMTP